MKPRAAAPSTQWLTHTCGYCGKKGGAYLAHYDLLRCTCGKMFWALQPQRNGPLVIFYHPSLNGQLHPQ